MRIILKKIWFFPFVLTALSVFFTGCGRSSVMTDRSGFFFDTTVDIRVNAKSEKAGNKLLDDCMALCAEMELIFSTENENSELYLINHRSDQKVTVSDDLRECLNAALKFCELSQGSFDITIYPVSSLWDFHAADPAVPDAARIAEALEKVDYRKVHLDGNTLIFDSEETMIDLGGIAKGYISSKLKALLKEKGCTSALINLGGNVSALGKKAEGKSWNVGIQKPFSDRGEILKAVPAEDVCVITSGIYERCFEEDGVRYHHIIDPKTGYPADTELTQVTMIGTDDAACDALATTAIISGKEAAEEAALQYFGGKSRVEIFYVEEDGVLRDIHGDPV